MFEASAARGILNRLLYSVPEFTYLMIVGSGMVDEAIRPVVGIYKNLTLEFCGGAGKGQNYHGELQKTLDRLVRGSINGKLLITGLTGLEGAAEAFRLLRPSRPDDTEHIKILIQPDLAVSEITAPTVKD